MEHSNSEKPENEKKISNYENHIEKCLENDEIYTNNINDTNIENEVDLLEKEDDFEVLMSPMLSNKFENIQGRLDNIESYLKENRDLYIDMLETIQKVSNENKKILKENREMYTEALKKIEETEKQNMNEIRPVLNNMRENNLRLEENVFNTPFQNSRIYNRFWRRGGLTSQLPTISTLSSTLPGLLGIPFIRTDNYNSLSNRNTPINSPKKIKNENDLNETNLV